jgi:hypothetical protein
MTVETISPIKPSVIRWRADMQFKIPIVQIVVVLST